MDCHNYVDYVVKILHIILYSKDPVLNVHSGVMLGTKNTVGIQTIVVFHLSVFLIVDVSSSLRFLPGLLCL